MKTVGDYWRALRRVRMHPCRVFYIDRGGDSGETVLLSGAARSGSTWIADCINYRNEYRYIFEPFHPKKLAACWHFSWRQYLRPENHDPTYLEPVSAIFSGQIRHFWIDQANRRFHCTNRLIKSVRADLLLPWVRARFPEVRIVLLFRHPCAVAASRVRLRWNADCNIFLKQPELMADHLDPFRDVIESAGDLFERHVVAWCIEYLVPLRGLRPGDVHLAFYEEFCANPEQEIRRLFAFLDKPVGDDLFRAVSRPSHTSKTWSAAVTGAPAVGNWTKHVSEAQRRRAVEILEAFGMDGVYAEGPMPNPAGADAILRDND